MKAVIFSRHGGAAVLTPAEVPVPAIRPTEALVEVKACALNHLDIWTRQGMPGVQIPLPHILGCDIAGVIRRLGRRTPGLTVGQSVVVAPGISCGRCPACRQGRESLCPQYNIVGFRTDGGYAQFVKVPIRNLIPISTRRWDYTEWAAVPLVFLTAWHLLITRGRLHPRETVLIHAAGSGTGSAAIQIAKWRCATVITTVGRPSKIRKAKALGADQIINYRRENFADAVLKITRRRGVDLVFEHIGPATWTDSLRSLVKGGRLVTCGATSGREVSLDLRFLFTRELSIAGGYMGSRQELDQVVRLVAAGRLRPVVDRVFPLARAAEAHRCMESRKHFGKIVLQP